MYSTMFMTRREDVRNETLSDVWKAVLSQEINWQAPELNGLSAAARAFLQVRRRRGSAAAAGCRSQPKEGVPT